MYGYVEPHDGAVISETIPIIIEGLDQCMILLTKVPCRWGISIQLYLLYASRKRYIVRRLVTISEWPCLSL